MSPEEAGVAASRSFGEVLGELAGRLTGTEGRLVPLDFGPDSPTIGFRIRETETHYIDVVEQLFNWRVCSTYKPFDGLVYDAGYCYLGKGADTFIRAVLGAAVWDGPGHGHPPGWEKNAFTGEWADGRQLVD